MIAYDATLWTPQDCRWCGGSGQHATLAYCASCHQTWSAADAAAYIDRQWGGWFGYALLGDWLWMHFARLQCGHRVNGNLEYSDPHCVACSGTGTRWHRLTPAEVRDLTHWSGTWGTVGTYGHVEDQPTMRLARYNPPVRPIRPLTPRIRNSTDARSPL